MAAAPLNEPAPFATGWTATFDASAETMRVPETVFLYHYNGTTSAEYDPVPTHDGKLAVGPRFDLAIGHDSGPVWLGEKNFRLPRRRQQQLPMSVDGGDSHHRCAAGPLFDPDPTMTNLFFGLGGELFNIEASQSARHWGVALEARHSTTVGGLTATIKAGIAYRRIDTALSIRITSSELTQYAELRRNAGYRL